MLKQYSISRWLIVTAMTLALGSTMQVPGLAAENILPEAGQSYRVIDVAADDRLNIRVHAGAEADIVGSLSSTANNILVTGSWQRIGGSIWWELILPGTERATGWVNSRFMIPELSGAARWLEAQNNYALDCGGTEPFWSLTIDGNQAQYSLMGENEKLFSASPWVDARGLASGSQFAIGLQDQGNDGFIVIVRPHGASCSDNMSDVSYPFYGTIVLPDGGVLGGCCSRAAR